MQKIKLVLLVTVTMLISLCLISFSYAIDYKEKLTEARNEISVQPSNPNGYQRAVIASAYLGEKQQALSFLQDIKKMVGETKFYYLVRAQMYEIFNDLVNAEYAYKNLFDASKDSYSYSSSLIAFYYRYNQMDKAKELMPEFIERVKVKLAQKKGASVESVLASYNQLFESKQRNF